MDIVDLIAQAGGLLGLAVFAIFMLNRVWELRLEECERNAKTERERADQVRIVIERNTQMMGRLLDVMARIDRDLRR